MSEAANNDARTGERLRIVIADDHEPTRVLLRTLIELEGMEVVGEARDGSEAVALSLAHEPDAVLLDVNMPGLDGLDAAEFIRAWHPWIRLVLHSGEPLDGVSDRAAALHLPLADKLDLPITIQQLAEQSSPPQHEHSEEWPTTLTTSVRHSSEAAAVGGRRGFVCEYGTPECDAIVARSVSEYEVVRASGAPILADGHTPTRPAAARMRARETRNDAAALRGEARHQARRAQRAVEAAGPES